MLKTDNISDILCGLINVGKLMIKEPKKIS